MALVPVGNGSGFWLAVTVIDNGGDKTVKQYELRAADYATAVIATTAVLLALDGVSDAVIGGYHLGFRAEEDAFVYPAAGVENQNKARNIVQLVGSTKKATIDIPAPDIEIFAAPSGANANVVDLLDIAFIAYMGLFEAAGECFLSDGETLDFAVEGRRVSSRKGFRG